VHLAQNSLAVVAALDAVGADLAKALPALGAVAAPTGRGARTQLTAATPGDLLLIDESYNANPASMRAALAAMATVPRATAPRRIAVLGDMLELGPQSMALHQGLGAAIEASDVDLLFTAGPHMKALHDHVCPSIRAGWAERSDGLIPAVLAAIQPGDVIMVKGSLGSRMAVVVDALQTRFRGEAKQQT
jgi:UDP-N-acetylmuramoyl-tripeptide--D-alanyl-D-alanine ligase